jgi:hypothetical protein
MESNTPHERRRQFGLMSLVLIVSACGIAMGILRAKVILPFIAASMLLTNFLGAIYGTIAAATIPGWAEETGLRQMLKLVLLLVVFFVAALLSPYLTALLQGSVVGRAERPPWSARPRPVPLSRDSRSPRPSRQLLGGSSGRVRSSAVISLPAS